VVPERGREEFWFGIGKVVNVCEVEVMEELVLPVAAIASKICARDWELLDFLEIFVEGKLIITCADAWGLARLE